MPPDKHFDDGREKQGAGVDAVGVVAGGVACLDPPPHRGADHGPVPAAFDDRHFGSAVLVAGVRDGEDVVDHESEPQKKITWEEGGRNGPIR
jgi:hypothetical protein